MSMDFATAPCRSETVRFAKVRPRLAQVRCGSLRFAKFRRGSPSFCKDLQGSVTVLQRFILLLHVQESLQKCCEVNGGSTGYKTFL